MSKICLQCKRNIDDVVSEDLADEYCYQADVLGECSLTESQQMLINGYWCEECYKKNQ